MPEIKKLVEGLAAGDEKSLARCITIVENELEGYEEILKSLPTGTNVPVIGVTGPPGAGKSTLINSMVSELLKKNRKVGVMAVDPTSPFTSGSILGDRIRMSGHFNNENVFIRSLATRGSLGGLSAKAIEVLDVMKAAGFDTIIIETVGVGQSEVEIAGLADATVLVLVPEAGDEVQTIKSGIMEIADVFVVNKSDRDGADAFVKNLHELAQSGGRQIPIIKTVAVKEEGAAEVLEAAEKHTAENANKKHLHLLAEKAYCLIQNYRMKDVRKEELKKELDKAMKEKGFNLYRFVARFAK